LNGNFKNQMKPQLFLLHFAGGNSYSFRFMNSLLTKFNIVALELPGRGDRLQENLLTDFDLAANDIVDQINKKLTSSDNFIIYGHSLGAYLALRVAGMLEKINRNPKHLIVSGNAGPGVREAKIHYLLEKNEFKKELKKMGGFPIELLENDEVFDFFEPVLRADFELIEKDMLNTEQPVNAPIYAFMGSEEKLVDKISNWSNFTTSSFDFEIVNGGHFFILEHPTKITDVINKYGI
jgi:external thioesterase TEII